MGMGRSKATSICPYLFHLHDATDNLLLGKKKAYQIAKAFLKHHVEPDNEDEPTSSEDLEGKSLSLREIRELQAQSATQIK